MAHEITAAIISGSCTIVAAGLAVLAASAGLKAWQHEAPGRRRLQLAEECLVAAYTARSALDNVGLEIGQFIGEDIRYESDWISSRRAEGLRRMREANATGHDELSKLHDITRLTELYFGDDLVTAYQAMRLYDLELSELRYKATDASEETAGPSDEKRRLQTILNSRAKEGEGRKEFEEVRAQPILLYERVLKPHLAVLATRRR